MIYNEEYASRLARALGLAPYATWIETFEGTDALVIERYDRDDHVPGRRLHQEDFNQVLGASGAEKYQEHSGKVSLAGIASVVASADGLDGLEQFLTLLTLVTLAVAVGNLDMHAKNISLLHAPNGTARLAPAYDVVPLTHYPGIDGRMAMSINDVYEHSRIRRADLIAEAGRWGLPAARADHVIEHAVAVIRATVLQETPHPRAVPELPALIDAFAARIGSSSM